MQAIEDEEPNYAVLPQGVSSEAVDFIYKCLKKEPRARPTVS